MENLVLVGSAVTGKGNSGDNYIYGDALHNVLLGGGGTDAMLGGAGDDIYVVTSANDAVIENADQGHDTVLSAATAYTLPDNVETLMLVGNAYDGTGNELNNLVVGNANNNVLDGGPAADILIGGRGRDNFVFHDGEANHDVVVDFKGNGSLTDDHLTFTGYGTADDGASSGAARRGALAGQFRRRINAGRDHAAARRPRPGERFHVRVARPVPWASVPVYRAVASAAARRRRLLAGDVLRARGRLGRRMFQPGHDRGEIVFRPARAVNILPQLAAERREPQ